MEEVGTILHGDKFKIAVCVKGSFKTGCFGVEEFIRRVQSSEEAFTKNDILKVRMRVSQWLTSKGMRTDYYIHEIIERRSALRQVDLFHQSP